MGIVGIHCGEEAIPFFLERIADINANDILVSEVFLRKESFCFIDSIGYLRENIMYMAVIKRSGKLVFVNMRQSETVCILGAQHCITLHICILIQLEFKRIEVLVSGAVNSAAVRQ